MNTWRQLAELARQRRQGDPAPGEPVTLRTLRPVLLFFGGLLVLTIVSRLVAPRPSQHAPAAQTAGASAAASSSAPATAETLGGGSETSAALAVFSPETDLEAKEAEAIAHARRSLDVAMDSFTDLELARRLIAAEARGVAVRVYRDHAEYTREEGARGVVTTTALLRSGGVEVRVRSAAAGAMSQRAYAIDGGLLRTGSTNWTPLSLGQPDQAVFYTQSPAAASLFEREFERLWTRPDNAVVP